MKYLLLLFMISCTSNTEFGECIGVLEDKNPKLEYRASKLNIFLAVVFSETVIVPLWVILEEHSCPRGEK